MLWFSVSDTIAKGPLPFLVQQRSLLRQTQKSLSNRCGPVEELGQHSLPLQLTWKHFCAVPKSQKDGKLSHLLTQEPRGKSNLHREYGASLTSLLPGQRLSGEEQSAA